MSYLFDCYAGIYDCFMKRLHLDDTKIIEKELAGKNYHILDIGGGSGTLANKLIKQGHHIIILDPSLAMLKQAHRKNPYLQLIHGYLNSDLKIDKVDVIICRDSFHHLANHKKSLELMKLYLKDNGFILIHDFDPQAKRIKLLFLFERCCFEKIHPITLNQLIALAKSKNYKPRVLHQGKWEYVCKLQKEPNYSLK